MVKPNFIPPVGGLATSRYTFRDHVDGYAFRHTADQIDMNPSVIGTATTVQDSFVDIANFISLQSGIGQGFITVGDGYNTWHAANGTINFDSSIPSLDTILNPIFSSIINNTTIPSGFERIKYGGIVLIKAGTYIVKHTINVPAGITILGEGYGTKIVNATALNTATSPPSPQTPYTISAATNASPIQITTSISIPGLVSGDTVQIYGALVNTAANGVWKITVIDSLNFTLNNSTGNGVYTANSASAKTTAPLFRITPDSNRSSDDIVDTTNHFIFARETKIVNLVICDNFVEPTILGDTNYKLPQNFTNSTVKTVSPLISQQGGSNLILDNVVGIGRVAGSITSDTGALLQLDNTAASNGTILNIRNCFIDGFAIPIIFPALAGSKDYLTIVNSKIRAFGSYIGDVGNAATNVNNCFILTNTCNMNIENNYFFTNITNNVNTALIIKNVISVPNKQARSKVIFCGNSAEIDKSNNATNSSFGFLDFFGFSPLSYLTSLVYGNTFQDQFVISTNSTDKGTPQITLDSTNGLVVNTNFFANPPIGSVCGIDAQTNVSSPSTMFLIADSVIMASSNGNVNLSGGVIVDTIFGLVQPHPLIYTQTLVTGPATYNVLTTDIMICCKTVGGVISLNLPAITTNGQVLVIKDVTGDASTNNIGIVVNGTDRIEGPATTSNIISSNFGSITYVSQIIPGISNGHRWYKISVI